MKRGRKPASKHLPDTAESALSMLPAVDTKTAAELLGLTENALVIMRKRDEGPAYMRYGRTIRYQQEDILAYRNQHRIDPKRVAR